MLRKYYVQHEFTKSIYYHLDAQVLVCWSVVRIVLPIQDCPGIIVSCLYSLKQTGFR